MERRVKGGKIKTEGSQKKFSGLISRVTGNQVITILLILIALGTYLSIHTGTFLTSYNIFNILRAFSWIGISAFGQSMVIIGG
ncbi:unnamed protein product, partial [marine sediment metagenome]